MVSIPQSKDRWAEWIKEKLQHYATYKEHLILKKIHRLKFKNWKIIFHLKGTQKKSISKDSRNFLILKWISSQNRSEEAKNI